MKRFRKWGLEKIVSDVVVQGNHKQEITDFFCVLVRAARSEFGEDNKVTIDDFLLECVGEALDNET